MSSPLSSLLFERDLTVTGSLALVLSIEAMLINLIYNHVYDRVDAHYGRVPTERKPIGRIIHAFGFETVLVAASVPIVMWWLELSWWQALLTELAVMAGVVVYTYLFTLAYDRWFPVPQSVPGN
jgi:uncharacterized membrane protein